MRSLCVQSELAQVLNCSQQRAAQLKRAGQLPEPIEHTISGHPLWSVDELQQWNAQRSHRPGRASHSAA